METILLEKIIYKLDFIDLNILEQIALYNYSLAFPILVKNLKKVNVWDRGIIRRRISKLKKMEIIHFEENKNIIVIEAYQHRDKILNAVKDLLKKRLIRY